MERKHHTPEEVVSKLPQVEVLQSRSMAVGVRHEDY